MSDAYEYFLQIYPPEHTVERPYAMWRRSDGVWEYLSIIDWRWHSLREDRLPMAPSENGLLRLTAERAAELMKNRQVWVRYWANYIDEPGPGVEPTTVLRRRASPEQLLDEAFGIEDIWVRTAAIVEFEYPGSSTYDHLVEIDQETAESIIRRISGTGGATEL